MATVTTRRRRGKRLTQEAKVDRAILALVEILECKDVDSQGDLIRHVDATCDLLRRLSPATTA
jgi:hypothetical protein